MAAINKATKGLNQSNTHKQAHCGAETWQNIKKKNKGRKESKRFCLTAVLNQAFRRTGNLMFLGSNESSYLCLPLFKHLLAGFEDGWLSADGGSSPEDADFPQTQPNESAIVSFRCCCYLLY